MVGAIEGPFEISVRCVYWLFGDLCVFVYMNVGSKSIVDLSLFLKSVLVVVDEPLGHCDIRADRCDYSRPELKYTVHEGYRSITCRI